ncbi:hypothetical protein DPX16_23563 [Anabarilius grahami]|uniref:Immunoglobulin subtype domain-containing protein n=1 Tax=Anabarilius grahami TaxID=495550 RepID=A0A3N0XQC5_ANAGA|nr:hypothetical protein DPX16_23563 [Anabarilius grahami]
MSISIRALVLVFITVQQVGGEVGDIKTVKVKEGGFLNLDPGLHDLNRDVQILWTFESPSQSTRVAQIYQGKVYTNYDEKLTGRVKLDRETGILTITDIRTNESGLYKAVTIVNKKITVQKYKVDVYAPVSVPAISSVSVHQSTGTSQGSQTGNSTTHPQTRAFCNNNQDSVESCGEGEVLIRLVLSGLVGIATLVFLVEHIRCCTRRGAQSSV